MINKAIAVSSISFSANDILMKELGHYTNNLVANSAGKKLADSELASFFNQNKAEVVIVGTENITQSVLMQCPQIKFIAKYGVGLDNLDLPLLKKVQIELGWTAGVNKRSVSELTLAFMLGHSRNIFLTNQKMKTGIWLKNGGTQLTGKRVGIVGFGHVGQDLANLLMPFACDVVYYDIADRESAGKTLNAQFSSYIDLLTTCDIITFHVPGGPDTFHLFGKRELEHVRKDVLIINTSRGSVVDFEATIIALREQRIGGFAADVYPEEPFDASQYSDLDSVYLTPHIGGNASEAVLAMGRSAINHVASYLSSCRQ